MYHKSQLEFLKILWRLLVNTYICSFLHIKIYFCVSFDVEVRMASMPSGIDAVRHRCHAASMPRDVGEAKFGIFSWNPLESNVVVTIQCTCCEQKFILEGTTSILTDLPVLPAFRLFSVVPSFPSPIYLSTYVQLHAPCPWVFIIYVEA